MRRPDDRRELERYRVTAGPVASLDADGNNGAFVLPPATRDGPDLRVIISDGEGWDHVSVSTSARCPTWEEMQYVKDAFFGHEEAVMQLHPPQSTYRNHHPYCLHLWRPQRRVIPLPDPEMVAPAVNAARARNRRSRAGAP